MMTPSDYIKHQLELWNAEFVGIHIRYAYDVETNFHMVEIDPEAIRRGNADYKKQELDFWMRFMSEYPEENLLISEPSNVNDMSNLIYSNMSDVLTCRRYDVTSKFMDNFMFNIILPERTTSVREHRHSSPGRVYALAA